MGMGLITFYRLWHMNQELFQRHKEVHSSSFSYHHFWFQHICIISWWGFRFSSSLIYPNISILQFVSFHGITVNYKSLSWCGFQWSWPPVFMCFLPFNWPYQIHQLLLLVLLLTCWKFWQWWNFFSLEPAAHSAIVSPERYPIYNVQEVHFFPITSLIHVWSLLEVHTWLQHQTQCTLDCIKSSTIFR